MSIIRSSLLFAAPAAATAYTIPRSIRLNAPDSAYLSRTPASAGNRRTWTLSFWIKRGTSNLNGTERLGQAGTSISNVLWFGFTTNGVFQFQNYPGSSTANLITSASYRDPSAWYHFLILADTTQATDTERLKIYVNGTVQLLSTASYPAQNADLLWNAASQHDFGCRSFIDSNLFNGYLADIHFIDGQALTPSSFGEFDTNNVWQPKAYTGTYGTNGFRLPFSDNSAATATTLGKDSAGSNNWTPNNFSVTAGAGNDSLVDSPSSPAGQTDSGAGGTVVGNYATLNPLDSVTQTLANGNLDLTNSNASWALTRATIGISSGKWYWEFLCNNLSTAVNSSRGHIGIATSAATRTSYLGLDSFGWGYENSNGRKVNANNFQSYGATYQTGDIIGVALDCDTGTLTFYKNGVSQGQAYSGLTSGPYFPAFSLYQDSSGGTPSISCNFGQRPFAYTAPSGFKALCTANLPTPTIANPATVFDTKLYTGNGSTQTISGLGFGAGSEVGLLWIKGRSGATDHAIYDDLRGAQLDLASNTTAAETTQSTGVTTLGANSFAIGSLAKINTSSATYAAWAWAGPTSTSTNTQGSITSQVRANVNAGFSIITYTGNGVAGATVGHGLGAVPQLIMIKARNAAQSWNIYTTRVDGSLDFLAFDTAAKSDSAQALPTSSVFSVSAGLTVNANTSTYVAYAWAPVVGYSSFGSFVSNGSADNAFVYTGFRPRFLVYKSSSVAGGWIIIDTSRATINVVGPFLSAESANAESSVTQLDILSNGFKCRDAGFANGTTYIYFAFAESPFAYARAR